MSLLKSHTFIAFLTTLAALGSAELARHCGFVISTETIVGFVTASVSYIFARQWKEGTKIKALVDTVGNLDPDANTIAQLVTPIVQAEIQKQTDALKTEKP